MAHPCAAPASEALMEQYGRVLSACALFRGMSPEEIGEILSCLGARVRRFARSETVLSEGSPARKLGIVLSGAVQIVRVDYYGSRSIVGTAQEGQLFSETFVYAGVEVMPVSVVASSECAALLIDARALVSPCQKACAFHSRLIYNLLHVLAAKNLMFTRKNEITSKKGTRAKLMAYLTAEAQRHGSSTFSIPFDRQALADYLNVDRSGLSAEIGRLRREGVIKCTKNQFTLMKPGDGEEDEGGSR